MAKTAFAVRRVPVEVMQTILSGALRPRPGDLVLATVERMGHHSHLELVSGRRASMHVGDEIIVAYADRYAPDQFESGVPAHLGPTDLVASGGIASDMLSRHRRVRRPTRIRPIGLVGTEHATAINVRDFALPIPVGPFERQRTIAVVGTSMNSGKTTIVRHLVHALHQAGLRPGATKVTGTGSGNDYWVMLDAGAHQMLDFTDAGFASTYNVPMYELEAVFQNLVGHLNAAGCGSILIEVADGIYQQETSQLIASGQFSSMVDAVIFAAPDALGAAHGVEHLRRLGLPVAAVGGVITSSPLGVREAEFATGVPVLTNDDLEDPMIATALLAGRPVPARQLPNVATSGGDGIEFSERIPMAVNIS